MNENINFIKLNDNTKKGIIESLIFASEDPIDLDTLIKLVISDNSFSNNEKDSSSIDLTEEIVPQNEDIKTEIKNIIDSINNELLETNRPYHIIEIAGGYQFATRKEYGFYIHKLFKSRLSRKLSQAALEVLAIIAYKQPITKAEIEQIRGVNSNEIVNSLLEKTLIEIVGRKDVLGHPLMYGTTQEFLKVFGLKDISNLPKYTEFEEILKERTNQFENSFFDIDLTDSILDISLLQDINNNKSSDSSKESL